MKHATVDLVVAGDDTAALAAAADAVRCGQRVLVVLRKRDRRVISRVRSACRAANGIARQVTVITNAEVVCVDGMNAVEAVVVRDVRTGRLRAVNASAFVSCGGHRLIRV